MRTVFARTGLVVARGGGAWGRLFPLFRAGLGGRLGDGRQYWSFIALHDEVAALRHLLDTGGLRPVEESTVIRLSGGKQTVLDGPFSEAKEVIGGFSVIDVAELVIALARVENALFAKSCVIIVPSL